MPRRCLHLLLWTPFLAVLSSETPCQISSDTLNGTVLTAEEGTTVTVPFTSSTSCGNRFLFDIYMVFADGYTLVCGFRVMDDVCHDYKIQPHTSCDCLPEERRYQLNMTVDRSHNGGHLGFDDIIFNVTYPATVTNMTLSTDGSQHEVHEVNSSVEVMCSWDTGNPNVTARLLDRHGVEMEGSNYSNGQIRYRFPAVGCRDAGLIRCEAPRASQNKSAILLVKCPPEFGNASTSRVSVVSGEDAEIDFPVRTHTTSISKCWLVRHLYKTPSNNNHSLETPTTREASVVIKCGSFVTLTGTPPDLTLSVRLDNVRKEEEGQWRLELTNDAGTGHVTFYLHVLEKDPATVTNMTLSTDGSQHEVHEVNSSVEVMCSWDTGNPPVTARLLDRHGVEMEGSNYSNGQIRYRFPAVGCQDAGLIRCEAPRASQNKSAILLVKCPPEFGNASTSRVSVVSGEDAEIDFPVRTHTTFISKCWLVRHLYKTPSNNNHSLETPTTREASVVIKCGSFVTLTGTPPDLTLTVRLDNVRKEDEGQWRLELTNDAGTGHVTFYIHVLEKVSSPVSAVVATLVVLLVVAIIVTVVGCAKRGCRPLQVPTWRKEGGVKAEEEDVELSALNVESPYNDDTYWEIEDDSVGAPSRQDAAPPLPCRRPLIKTLSVDYLTPTVSCQLKEQKDTASTHTLPVFPRRTNSAPRRLLVPLRLAVEEADPLRKDGLHLTQGIETLPASRRRANSLPADLWSPAKPSQDFPSPPFAAIPLTVETNMACSMPRALCDGRQTSTEFSSLSELAACCQLHDSLVLFSMRADGDGATSASTNTPTSDRVAARYGLAASKSLAMSAETDNGYVPHQSLNELLASGKPCASDETQLVQSSLTIDNTPVPHEATSSLSGKALSEAEVDGKDTTDGVINHTSWCRTAPNTGHDDDLNVLSVTSESDPYEETMPLYVNRAFFPPEQPGAPLDSDREVELTFVNADVD